MTKHNAHEFLPLLQALVDGKNLQFKSGVFGNSHWEDVGETQEIGFYDAPEYYRIKPEPRTWVIYQNVYTHQISHQSYSDSNWERIEVQEVLK